MATATPPRAGTTGDGDGRLIRIDAPSLGHIPNFDGLRGIFIAMVVLYHADLLTLIRGMPLIIDWFFVASGFLITSLMLDERRKHGTVSLRNFYTRRVLRLFPAMYAMLAVFSVMMLLVIASGRLSSSQYADVKNWWVDVLAAGTYVYNIVASIAPDQVTAAIGHTWSLTVEEQFYFVWPLLMLAVLRRASRRADVRLLVGSIAFIALMFYLRARFQWIMDYSGDQPKYMDQDDPTWQGIVYRLASCRPDMIVYGCLIAFAARAVPRPLPEKLRRAMAVAGPLMWAWFVLVLCLGGRAVWGFELFGGPAYQLALLLLGPITLDLYFRQESPYARAFSWKHFRWLGLRTYGIYLWHVLPLLFFLPAIENSYGVRKLALGLVAAALGISAGLASYQFIERRFLGMKGRFSGPAPAAATPASATSAAATSAPATASAALDAVAPATPVVEGRPS